jgi:hypothetical protein
MLMDYEEAVYDSYRANEIRFFRICASYYSTKYNFFSRFAAISFIVNLVLCAALLAVLFI